MTGHSGAVLSIVFSPDGRTLFSGSTDSTVLLWDITGRLKDGQLQPIQLLPNDLEKQWKALASEDGPQAYQAIWTLVAASKQAVPLLQERLRPLLGIDAKRIAALVADLNSDDFATREKATQELEKLAELAIPILRKTLANPPSLEVRRRIERVLAREKGAIPWSQERLRVIRTIDVLEKIGSAEARQVLESLSKGGLDAELTQEAKASLERLEKR